MGEKSLSHLPYSLCASPSFRPAQPHARSSTPAPQVPTLAVIPQDSATPTCTHGTLAPRRDAEPVGMQRDPKQPQGTREGLGKCPTSPGLGTLVSHQDRGWAATQWCSYRGGCLGPSAPPCHPLPSPGARPSLPDLLRTCWGQGRIVQLRSGRRGLGGGWGAGGSTASPGPVGPLPPWPWAPSPLFPGEPMGSGCLGSSGVPPDTQPALSPHLTPHLGEPPEKGLQGASVGPPRSKPLQGWSRIPPAPAKAALGHPHRHPMGCLGVPLEPLRAGPG